jgi:predicted permease
MLFVNLLTKIFALFLMMAVGVFLKHKNLLDDHTTQKLSKIFLIIFYPCMIFAFLVKNFTIQNILNESILPISAFLIMLTGYFVGLIAVKFIYFDTNKQKNMFQFQCLLNNFSFLPLPIIIMLFGEKLASKHLFSTLGAEFAIWTIGVFCLTGEKINRNSIKNLFRAPVISILLALTFLTLKSYLLKYNFSTPIFIKNTNDSLFFVIEMFGKATIPSAMLIAGSRMYGIKLTSIFEHKQIYLAFLRLLIIPSIIIALLKILPLKLDDSVKNIITIVAIMPCAVNSIVFSEIFNSDTEKKKKSVLATHIFSLVTIPLWIWIFVV